MIIAFGHRKRVGKDWCAAKLASRLADMTRPGRSRMNYGGVVLVEGFAVNLKKICHKVYGWAGMEDYGYYEKHPEAKEVVLPALDKSPRQIMLDVGMALRKVYLDTWVDCLLQPHIQHGAFHHLVIPDLRFPNEFEAVKKLGGVCVKVERLGFDMPTDEADEALASETRWDYILRAPSGDLDGLRQQVHDMAESIFNSA